MIIRLAMIGFGTVGQEFVRLLQAKRSWLLSNKGMDVEVLAISTTHHGSLLSKKALDLEKVMSHLRTEGTLKGFGPEATDLSPIKIRARMVGPTQACGVHHTLSSSSSSALRFNIMTTKTKRTMIAPA